MDTTRTITGNLRSSNDALMLNLKHIPFYLTRPVRFIKGYDRSNLRPDLMAGLTVGVILLPQAIAFALIAELPPQMGLYAAIIGGFVGALWGSSNQINTGPTNAISLLVLSVLLTVAEPGTPEFIVAAGLVALMVGVFQLAMGLARLGVLVNFVSHSVVVGFSTGAGVLIGINQLRSLLGLSFTSHTLMETVEGVWTNISNLHVATAALGIGTMVIIVLLKKFSPKLPAALLSMVIASVLVYLFGLDEKGVSVIGQLPTELPPLADLPLLDLDFISQLSAGALAVGAIGLVETSAISRSIAAQTGQRLDSNQEFVGQGLANIAVGFFSGYPVAGSFSRSAVSFEAGARSAMSAVISSSFVLVGMFALAPLAVYLPRTALSGVLIVTAYNMVDKDEITRILQGTRGDALIMIVTFFGTLLLHIEFAVLLGILLSFALYIMKTSVPRVFPVVPDKTFNHFIPHKEWQDLCPQLGILKISGDLYFGAVSHVEEEVSKYLTDHVEVRYLLLRMQGVNQCDFSGIHMLESVRQSCLDKGGDLYFMKVQPPIKRLMNSTGFYQELGDDHFLDEDTAIVHLFYKALDPAICIYECPVRVFKECQNLPKPEYTEKVELFTDLPLIDVPEILPMQLWNKLLAHNGDTPPLVIDVREPREFRQGHIAQAQLIPLPKILSDDMPNLPSDRDIVFVCRGGRRSTRAASVFKNGGQKNVSVLRGGMLAWEAAGLLEAVESAFSEFQ